MEESNFDLFSNSIYNLQEIMQSILSSILSSTLSSLLANLIDKSMMFSGLFLFFIVEIECMNELLYF